MKVSFGIIASLLFVGVIVAQEPAQKPSSPPPQTNRSNQAKENGSDNQQHSTGTQSGSIEHELIAVKLAGNRNEIEISKLAQGKAENEQVRQFAAKMIKDHEKAATKLEGLAGQHGSRTKQGTSTDRPRESTDNSSPRTDNDAPGKAGGSTTAGAASKQDRPAGGITDPAPSQRTEGNAGQARSGQSGDKNAQTGNKSGSMNWATFHQQLADQCLASAKRELGSKEGAEFDKCYMAMQVAEHQKMIDMDHVAMNYVMKGSHETMEECMKTAVEHLREAKEIVKSLEGKTDGATRSAASGETNTKE